MDKTILIIILIEAAVSIAIAELILSVKRKDRQKPNDVAPTSAEPEKPQNSDIKRMILPLAVCILGAGAINGALTGLGYTLGGLGAMLLYLCAGLIAYIWISKK